MTGPGLATPGGVFWSTPKHARFELSVPPQMEEFGEAHQGGILALDVSPSLSFTQFGNSTAGVTLSVAPQMSYVPIGPASFDVSVPPDLDFTGIAVIPLTFQGSGAANADNIAIPTHAVDDDIYIFAFRNNSTTVPTKPTAALTVPAWADIDAPPGSNGCSARTAHFKATATNHTSGVWTNATSMVVAVMRGQAASPIGGHALSGGTAVNQAVAPATTLIKTDGTSIILEFHGQTGTNSLDNWDAAPTGYTRRAATTQASGSTRSCLNTKTTTTSDGAVTQTGPSAFVSAGYQGATIEILD